LDFNVSEDICPTAFLGSRAIFQALVEVQSATFWACQIR
jgi:hypothetical protein